MTDKLKRRNWPRAVVMDLDGTLIDSAPDIAHALNQALVDAGIDPFSLNDVRLMIGGGVPKLVERAFKARALVGDLRLAPTIDAMLSFYAASPAGRTRIYDGVGRVLEVLKDEGVKIGLCTNKPQSITELVLDELQLTNYFSSIVGGTAETPRKPDPTSLRLCVEGLGFEADDCLMIGDSGADRGAAEALDMAVFLVSYGYSKVPVATLQPDAVLDSMGDLLSHLYPERTGEVLR